MYRKVDKLFTKENQNSRKMFTFLQPFDLHACMHLDGRMLPELDGALFPHMMHACVCVCVPRFRSSLLSLSVEEDNAVNHFAIIRTSL